ncbi:hypothetical protein WHI96_12970 [Pseudonocardia tropica]|uniref:Uncharacterized protein n=1 Tax=Pseudonocardia tropica TaxID=681289 RepID=A0ABV1JUW4_9PSEU
MNEVLRVVRTNPDGGRSEAVLATEDGRHILTSDDGTTRELPGQSLAAVLSAAPELTVVDAVTRVDATCAAPDVRAQFVDALQDADPTAPFDESAWPAGTELLPVTDEWPAADGLRYRWITIDGAYYHLLPAEGRTRAVQVEDGEIVSGEEVASASWDFEGIGLSSVGRESLRIVGGDVLVRQNLGDDFPEMAAASFDGDVISAVVRWLDDQTYAPSYLLRSLPTPGLTADERSDLGDLVRQDVAVFVDGEVVLDRLCAAGDRNKFRRALADPASLDGARTYALLRAIMAGEEPMDDLLGTLV